MNYRTVGYLFGVLLLLEACLLAAPFFCALAYGEALTPYLYTMAALVAVGTPLVLQKPKNIRIFALEGFLCVAGSWVLLSLFGSLPFLFSGTIPNFFDAFFETVSGFTTTGASILGEVESLPRGILFWRSFTHWVGGMGVLVFMLAVLPSDNSRAMHLLRAEVPGPQKGKLVPKLRRTAMILYGIYVCLTFVQTVALLIAGLPLYDALVTALGTAGTGGFAVKNLSIAGYGNPAAEWIIALFMFLFGVNFNLYFFLLIGRAKEALKSEELRTYLLITVLSTAVIALNISSLTGSFSEAIRTAFFQVTSISSTTGYATADFNLWPSLSKTVIICLMFLGACAGSTAGGLKVSRVVMLVKGAWREVRHTLRPRSCNVTRLDGNVLPEETVRATGNYLMIYTSMLLMTALLISTDGFDLVTNFTASLTCISNVGPGLSLVGPLGNFAGFSWFSKLILSLEMLFGRLEFFPMMILFAPRAWKRP